MHQPMKWIPSVDRDPDESEICTSIDLIVKKETVLLKAGPREQGPSHIRRTEAQIRATNPVP